MRSATEIVEAIAREICGSAKTLDSLERRAGEFRQAAAAAPTGSMAKAIATTVVAKLDQLHTALAVTRFSL